MIGLKGKIIAAAAVAVCAFSAGWTVSGWRHDAEIKGALEAQAEQHRQALAEARKAATVDEVEAAKLSHLLDDIRRERDMALDELDARPTLTRTITKVITNDTPCSCDALGADFRRLWNDPTSTEPHADPRAPSSD